MLRLLIVPALAATTLLTSAAAKDPFAGYVPGTPVECIDKSTYDEGPAIYDAHTIVYRTTGRTLYRTQPIGTCPALRPDSTLIVEIYGGHLCRNDRFRAREPGDVIPGPVCRFDRFTPYKKAPR